MASNRVNYTKAMVICHGLSEVIFAQNIKSNLRLPVHIYSRNNGSNPIQINGLIDLLSQKDFSSIHGFQKYNHIILDVEKSKIRNFKVFIVMDTDDISHHHLLDMYKDKSLFKNHWLYDYIVPIYNLPNLDEVCINAGYPINIKQKSKSYTKIFPGLNGDTLAFQDLISKFESVHGTNINEMLLYFNLML